MNAGHTSIEAQEAQYESARAEMAANHFDPQAWLERATERYAKRAALPRGKALQAAAELLSAIDLDNAEVLDDPEQCVDDDLYIANFFGERRP